MASNTVEEYVKQLYLEQQQSRGNTVPMGRLAAAMGVVPGTVTSMVRALSDAKLVAYEPRGGVRLTRSGERLALHVLRRQRLVELFLVKVLGLDWSVVHEESDQLEHAISERVLERMDVLLGHPVADPHGDPIPTPKGEVHEPDRLTLADCPIGVPQKVARVNYQDPKFLKFVERQGLMPGSHVTVEKRESAAEVVNVRLPSGGEVSLGDTVAARILVEPARVRSNRDPGRR